MQNITREICVGDASSDGCEDEMYTGLRAQDLQEAKDHLVVESADMLHIPLFVAESLLRENGINNIMFKTHEYSINTLLVAWSREVLLEKWIADPAACCDSVGLLAPLSLSDDVKNIDVCNAVKLKTMDFR